MSPLLETAAAILGPVLASAAGSAIRAWSEHRQPAGYAVAEGGREYELAYSRASGFAVPVSDLYFPGLAPTEFAVAFTATDDRSYEWLEDDQPVITVIHDLDATELDAVVTVTTLEEGFLAQMYPGEYLIASFVFYEDDLDGLGFDSFTISPGEGSFVLQAPIVGLDDSAEAEEARDGVVRILTALDLDEDYGELLGRRVCDSCWWDDDITSWWTITKKGKMKCAVCGAKDDFYSCDECANEWFRRTKRDNYRCLECDTKVVP